MKTHKVAVFRLFIDENSVERWKHLVDFTGSEREASLMGTREEFQSRGAPDRFGAQEGHRSVSGWN